MLNANCCICRLAERAERRNRLEKRWAELKELFTPNSTVATEA